MATLASLDNEVIFKKAFTDKMVFEAFVKDIIGIEIEVEKIETEKQFSPKIGNIDFKLDIFAESIDRRVVIELQRIEYDHNFDRFLHYFLALIIEQQKRSKEYGIDQIVYAIVIMTEPYTIKDKTEKPVRNEVLMLEINPTDILGKKVPLYGHQFIVLNPNHSEEQTPQATRDWLDLIYQSIHNPERAILNKNNKGIQRASELISYDNLTPQEVATMKNKESSRTVMFIRSREEKKRVVIKSYQAQIPVETIANITDLTVEEVENIINDYQ